MFVVSLFMKFVDLTSKKFLSGLVLRFDGWIENDGIRSRHFEENEKCCRVNKNQTFFVQLTSKWNRKLKEIG